VQPSANDHHTNKKLAEFWGNFSSSNSTGLATSSIILATLNLFSDCGKVLVGSSFMSKYSWAVFLESQIK